ncbi:hypothetical protein PZA11_007722 [Diplocarpon coronariae]
MGSRVAYLFSQCRSRITWRFMRRILDSAILQLNYFPCYSSSPDGENECTAAADLPLIICRLMGAEEAFVGEMEPTKPNSETLKYDAVYRLFVLEQDQDYRLDPCAFASTLSSPDSNLATF